MGRAGTWLTGWIAILACYYAGKALVIGLALPLPPALLGLLLLLAGLMLRSSSSRAVAQAASPLLKHMSVLFVPAVMGVGMYAAPIREYALSLFIAIVVTTAVSLGLTAWVTSRILASRLGKS
ncbi:CidA/LrgA family protein [Alteromonas halophila]|uniref:CidA/LrgA family protein n=1 Tax=Alteromonas halophila TaxID=516698 RepID=A0A918JC24_9ALTE|nr:CidA/LrgA family protein [Alteromonas halophila]GGW72640.1 hypothetical protein GCM10007391_00110 [Alteromonas halophila]